MMTRIEALGMASKALGAYSKVAILMGSDHMVDAENFKGISKRLALKGAKDLYKTTEAYGEVLEELERMYEKDVELQTYVEACLLFTFTVNSRMTELQELYAPYSKLSGYAKSARLKSMIRSK